MNEHERAVVKTKMMEAVEEILGQDSFTGLIDTDPDAMAIDIRGKLESHRGYLFTTAELPLITAKLKELWKWEVEAVVIQQERYEKEAEDYRDTKDRAYLNWLKDRT